MCLGKEGRGGEEKCVYVFGEGRGGEEKCVYVLERGKS